MVLSGIWRGIISFLTTSVLAGVFIYIGVDPSELVADFLDSPWISHPLSRIVAFVVGGLFGFFMWRSARSVLSSFEFSRHWFAGKKNQGSDFMPLNVAVKEAYERTLGSEYAHDAEEFARGTDNPDEELLNYYAQYFFGEDDPPIYGYEPPSRELRRLPRGAGTRGNPIQGGSSYIEYSDKNPRYIGLQVERGYLDKIVRELKSAQAPDTNRPELIPFLAFYDMAIAAGWPKDRNDKRWINFKDRLRESARNGWVQLWGRPEVSNFAEVIAKQPREPIPHDHWRDFEIEYLGILAGVENIQMRSCNPGIADWGAGKRYRDLHIERAAAREWLRQNKCM